MWARRLVRHRAQHTSELRDGGTVGEALACERLRVGADGGSLGGVLLEPLARLREVDGAQGACSHIMHICARPEGG